MPSPLPPPVPYEPVRDDDHLRQILFLHDDLFPNVGTVFARITTPSNRLPTPTIVIGIGIIVVGIDIIIVVGIGIIVIVVRHLVFVLIGVQNESREAARMSFANERQLSSAVEAIVENQTTSPLTRTDLRRNESVERRSKAGPIAR